MLYRCWLSISFYLFHWLYFQRIDFSWLIIYVNCVSPSCCILDSRLSIRFQDFDSSFNLRMSSYSSSYQVNFSRINFFNWLEIKLSWIEELREETKEHLVGVCTDFRLNVIFHLGIDLLDLEIVLRNLILLLGVNCCQWSMQEVEFG